MNNKHAVKMFPTLSVFFFHLNHLLFCKNNRRNTWRVVWNNRLHSGRSSFRVDNDISETLFCEASFEFLCPFLGNKKIPFRIANFRWVWETFIWVTRLYIALFIMDVHYKTLFSISGFNPYTYTLFSIQSCLLDKECKAFQFSTHQ